MDRKSRSAHVKDANLTEATRADRVVAGDPKPYGAGIAQYHAEAAVSEKQVVTLSQDGAD